METRANYITVGIFVLACFLGLTVAAVWAAGAQIRQEFAYYRTAFLGPVTGLARGTVVRYNGIEVGSITELAFDREDPRRVFVLMQIDPMLALHVDSVASIESQGLTGGVYIEIAGGAATSPLAETEAGQQYPFIPSRPSTLQQLAEAGPELVNRFSTVGARLGDAFNDENRKLLSEMLAHLRNTSALIDHRSEDLDAIITNLQVATAALTKTLGTVDRAFASTDRVLSSVDTAVGSLNGAINSADTTMQKLGQLSDSLDKTVNGQGAAQLTQIMGQTRALIARLNRLTSDLEREPTRLLLGDRRQGYAPQ